MWGDKFVYRKKNDNNWIQCHFTVGLLYKSGISLDPHDYIIVTNRPQKPRKPKQPEIWKLVKRFLVEINFIYPAGVRCIRFVRRLVKYSPRILN